METDIVHFRDNKKFILGNLDTKKLKHYTLEGHFDTTEDLRFELFDKDKKAHALLVDIDHCPLLKGLLLMDDVEKVFGEGRMTHLFTGQGHHVYIWLGVPFSQSEAPLYKQSFIDKCKELQQVIKFGEVDLKTFGYMKYGRVPESINSKNGNRVKYIKENNGSLGSIDGYLERSVSISKVIKPEIKNVYVTEPTESVIYKNCAFIRHCKKESKTLTHPEWNAAMCIASFAEDKNLAHYISEGYEDYDPQEVENYFDSEKMYPITCGKINDIYTEASPCYGCAHASHEETCPSLITGPLPAPSAKYGYHMTRKSKDGLSYKIPNFNKIETADVANCWINTNMEKVLVNDDNMYYYDENKWSRCVEYHQRKVTPTYMISKQIDDIPKGGIRSTREKNEVTQLVINSTKYEYCKEEDFDPRDYINVNNGVLDIKNIRLLEHDRCYKLREMYDINYDADADHPVWTAFLNEALPSRSDQLLLQNFFGLALSNIPTRVYQSYLWLHGASGTGKSTVLDVISDLVTAEKTCVLNSEIFSSEKGLPFDMRGKNLAFYDEFKMIEKESYVRQWEVNSNNIVSSHNLSLRLMYRGPITLADPKATLIVTSNDSPSISSSESGTVRRLRSISFHHKPKNLNPFLKDELMKEKAGILNWALKGLKYFYKKGLPERSAREKRELDYSLAVGDNMAVQFVEGAIKKGSIDDTIPRKAMLARYIDHTNDHQAKLHDKKTIKEINKVMSSHFSMPTGGFYFRRSEGYVYKGFKFKEKQ